jgi:hypothetical protein
VNVSFDNICQYFIISYIFFQYLFHVLTFFLKFCQSGDRGKGPIPNSASTENDEYISDEGIFDSRDPL